MDPEVFEVAIVDDDPSVRGALARLTASIGCSVTTYTLASEYLARAADDWPHCLLLDLFLPDLDGLEVQRRLAQRPMPPPIIFMSGHADIPTCAFAMKSGALEFLVKPIRAYELLAAVQRARTVVHRAQQQREQLAALTTRLDSLSMRERQVLTLVSAGHLNKQIAALLGLSEPTVKLHRATVMRKMGADSVASLVRMSIALGDRLGIEPMLPVLSPLAGH